MENIKQIEANKIDRVTGEKTLTGNELDPCQFDSYTQRFLSRYTSSTVRRGITLFQEFYKGNIRDFFLSVDEDKHRSVQERRYIEREVLQNFATFLMAEGNKKKRPWTGKTINCYMGAVQAYFSFYDMPISFKKIDLPPDHVTYEKHSWDLEEFTQFISTMKHLKYQAFTVCLFQSGLSCSDLLDRKYGDVKQELEAGIVPVCLAPPNRHIFRHKRVGRNKHVKFLTFIGEAGIRFFKMYLATRDDLTDESPLFDIDEQIVEQYIGRHARKLYGNFEGMNPWRLHGLRDFFKKRALKSELRSKEGECYIEYFSAHDLSEDVEKRYNTMTREEWRDIYKVCQPFLELTLEIEKKK